jgi:hypothetical protein
VDDQESRQPAPGRVDSSARQPARRYDYVLGGTDNRLGLAPVEPRVQSVSRWWAEDAPSPPPVEAIGSNGIVLRVVRP